MILPYDANPGRMEFSERTRVYPRALVRPATGNGSTVLQLVPRPGEFGLGWAKKNPGESRGSSLSQLAVGNVGVAFARVVLRAVRATLRPVLRAVRATLRPVLRAVRATLRPVLRGVRAVLRAVRAVLRPVLRTVRATFRPVLRTVRAVLRAVRLVVAIVFLRFCLMSPSARSAVCFHR